jgi:hypothetical protein
MCKFTYSVTSNLNRYEWRFLVDARNCIAEEGLTVILHRAS